MSPKNDLLPRLLKAAAKAPRLEDDTPSFALESRALVSWRLANSGDERDGVLRFLRIGLGLASVLMLVIIALSFRSIPKDPADELATPTVVLDLALLD
ncbi:MAG: hypothetical protein HYY23_19685 [Verrucomicrobia bacterium]|nr:hypothetical protein [Verrucomicrobiota bacterium]